jgi:hypothetical protein
MIFRKYSFQKLTQFSQGNKVLHDHSSNTDVFLSRDSCVSSNQLNRSIWGNKRCNPPWKLWFAKNIPVKTISILTGKQYARCSCFWHTWFYFERYMCFFNIAEQAHFKQYEPFPSWILWFEGYIPSKTNSILTGKQCARWSCYNPDGFLL